MLLTEYAFYTGGAKRGALIGGIMGLMFSYSITQNHNFSDKRLKDNITNCNTKALEKVKELQAVSFEWNETIKIKKET